MSINRIFLKCDKCGTVASLFEDLGHNAACCGQLNKEDASSEKHVPQATIISNVLWVQVGSVPHPMTEEHHIGWIAITQGPHTQRIVLQKTGPPMAGFCIGGADITIYAYCNLHGLWSSEIDCGLLGDIQQRLC